MLDSLLQALSSNEATINAIVGLLTLGAAIWGAIQLTVRGRSSKVSQELLPLSSRSRTGSGRWSRVLNLGLGSHSRLEHLVSVRSVNVVLFGLGIISLIWLMVTLGSADTVLLSVLNLLVFTSVLTGFVLQWNGKTNSARWVLIGAANGYWIGCMVAVGPRAGTEYFLVANMMLPVLVFSRSEVAQMLAALLLVLLVFALGVWASLNAPPLLQVSAQFVKIGYVANALLLAMLIVLSVSYYRSFAASSYHELEVQQKENDLLMSSLYPERILRRLERNEPAVADWHADATVLYVSVSGFSKLHDRVPALELVGHLGEIFAAFDQLAQKYGLDKIKTLGTTYVAATGIGGTALGPAAVVECALAMRHALSQIADSRGLPLSFHCGVAAGIAISGVMADARPRYDLWGEALESAVKLGGEAASGAILVEESLTWRLGSGFDCRPDAASGTARSVNHHWSDDAEPAAAS